MPAPTLDDLKSWLGLQDTDVTDDPVLQQSLDATLVHLDRVVVYPVDEFGEAAFPADMTEAVFLVAQRLAARRNSPEGIVGLTGTGGDFTAARVPWSDPDVMQLIAPYRIVPVS